MTVVAMCKEKGFLLVLSERLGNRGPEILPSLHVLCFLHKKKEDSSYVESAPCVRCLSAVFLLLYPLWSGGRKAESNLLLASHYFRFSYLVLCPFKPLSVILAATEPFTGQ
jgi:hypothetical protein